MFHADKPDKTSLPPYFPFVANPFCERRALPSRKLARPQKRARIAGIITKYCTSVGGTLHRDCLMFMEKNPGREWDGMGRDAPWELGRDSGIIHSFGVRAGAVEGLCWFEN